MLRQPVSVTFLPFPIRGAAQMEFHATVADIGIEWSGQSFP
jgi:hypothetical protein